MGIETFNKSMNRIVVQHLKSILEFRDNFMVASNIENDGEIMKIWARWIITHRSLFPQKSLFLPDDNEFDPQFIVELCNKGITLEHSHFLHDMVLNESINLNLQIDWYSSDNEFGGLHAREEKDRCPVDVSEYNNEVAISCDGASITIPCLTFNKMLRCTGHLGNLQINYIWYTCMLYQILDGKGFQWAVPNIVMNILKYKVGCDTELFASPINSVYKKYYSLFPHDTHFGSLGNFFNAPDTSFKSGAFQVNPPFIDCLFTLTTTRILRLLSIAEAHGESLTFVYIMPHWNKFVTYDMAIESPYCVKQINLKAYNHYYYQSITNTYIKARFGTSIIFLSTNSRCCDNSVEFDIIAGFNSGHR